MIILHVNNWDSVDIFRLNTTEGFLEAFQGIVLSPFAHSSNKHLINNVVPLFFLMSLIRYIFDKFSYVLFIFLYILTGLLSGDLFQTTQLSEPVASCIQWFHFYFLVD